MASYTKRKRKGWKMAVEAEVNISGFPRKSETFPSMKEAKAWADRYERELREGTMERSARAALHTTEEMFDRYERSVLIHKRSERYIKYQRAQLVWWRARLAGYTLAALSSSVLVECRDELFETRGPGTVNRYMALIRHVLKMAHKQWQWMAENPMPDAIRLPEPPGRVRFLDEAEKLSIMRACRDESLLLYLFVVMLVATGARKGEVLALRWKDVDFSRGRATLHHTKNHERRAIYLHGLSAALMQHRRKHADKNDRVLDGVHPDTLERQWRRARNAAKVKDFRIHDLRHTFASYAAMSGMDALMLSEALGHKDIKMVKRYAHLMESHVSDGVRKANDKIFGQQEAI